MPALRCSNCGISYPANLGHQKCDVCDEKTTYFSNVAADPEWEETVRLARLSGAERPVGAQRGDARANRVWNYLRMGFEEHDADMLADVMYSYGRPELVPLHWSTVEEFLKAAQAKGFNHEYVLTVFV